jgi:hypothetical protein
MYRNLLMKIFSFSAISADDFVKKAQQLPGFKPTLGIVFSSPAVGIAELAKASQSLGYQIFGCSTDGEISNTVPEDPVLQQSAVCCLLDLPPSLFAISVFEKKNDSSFVLGQNIGHWGKQQFGHPAFIIGVGGLTLDGEAIIRGMQSMLPKGTVIIGGTAGDDGAFERTMVFSDKALTDAGVAALAFDNAKVRLEGFTTSGWTGVGTDMTVTSSEGNLVRSINGQPAVDVLVDYLRIPKEDLISIAVRFPLIVYRADGSEVLRAALAADLTAGSVIFAGSVPQGSKVRFSSSFGYETIEQAVRELKEYHARIPGADLILVFSCTARHYAAGSMIKDEIAAVSDLWGVPILGFFTYGEIGQSSTNTCDFFNETLSLALIRFTR